MSDIQELPYVWMDGELIPRAQATLPVGSAAVSNHQILAKPVSRAMPQHRPQDAVQY